MSLLWRIAELLLNVVTRFRLCHKFVREGHVEVKSFDLENGICGACGPRINVSGVNMVQSGGVLVKPLELEALGGQFEMSTIYNIVDLSSLLIRWLSDSCNDYRQCALSTPVCQSSI